MTDACWPSLLTLALLILAGLVGIGRRRWPSVGGTAGRARVERVLKARTPDDCPACCRHSAGPAHDGPPRPTGGPWGAVKSRRGAPKRIATDGFACSNAACAYYRVADARVHALVGDGRHGKAERIQTFRCQACRTTFSARRDTPLYRLRTPSARIGEVLTALAEGLDISAAARVFGHRPATIATWLARAGAHGTRLHARWFHDLHLPHIQLDEVRTRLRNRAHVVWLWVAVEPVSKLVPVLHLGARTQASAHAVVHALRRQLAPGCLPAFTSDGLRSYFYALTAHFGDWLAVGGRQPRRWRVAPALLYGQVRKQYHRRRLVRVSHAMRCGTREQFRRALVGCGLSGRLNTAFVERVNLTLRQGVAALTRRTWATRQQARPLLAHLEWWRAYYHFVRPHRSLRVALARPTASGRGRPRRFRPRTPAMAAGLTDRPWTVRELLLLPLPAAAPGGG
jgi:IS1 family transposase